MQRAEPSSTHRWIIWMVVVVPIVLVTSLVAYGLVARPACGLCHVDAALRTASAASSHATVSCGSCHAPTAPGDRVLFGFRQVRHLLTPFLLDDGREWAAVPDVRCLGCHETVVQQVVTANGVRVDHSFCAEGSECTDCHSTVAHGEAVSWVRVYDMETCLECHTSQDASLDCALCHEGRLPADRVTTGVFAITHGPEWESTHGMGNSSTCSACHTAASCETCHGPGLPHGAGFMDEHSSYSQLPNAQCDSCHEVSFCETCHGLAMPHTPVFVREHAEAAKEDRDLCRRCHVDSDCTLCHETHVHPGGAIGTLPPGGAD